MNSNSAHLSMCEHSVAKLMTHRSESQDDMNKSTSDYVFWKINHGSGRQRGEERIHFLPLFSSFLQRGEKKNEGDEIKF